MPFKNFTDKNLELKSSVKVDFEVNGRRVQLETPCTSTLLDILRYELKMTGAKEGCGMGECGACTVIMDGEPITSCLVLATGLNGKKVFTIEGVRELKDAKPIIDAFVKHAAVQCGFCTPGMIMASYALLKKNPNPSEDDIREGLSGNLCRCTGYVRIVEAVKEAARELNKGEAA